MLEYLKIGDVVIFESTVYPGVTEDFCAPIIANTSSLKYNQDFFVGYSPERINPGDKSRRIRDITKVTSGSNNSCATYVNALYAEIITAGTYKAKDIKTAEAAKLIENVQRDINIALVNELSILFQKLDIQTKNVLETASTKWNFLNFKPGLVGGHCIGIDPYYLTHKAREVNYNPKLILAGRVLNDGMAKFVSETLIMELYKIYKQISNLKVLILGITFKENCPDFRNTKVFDIFKFLKEKNLEVDVYDPLADNETVETELGIQLLTQLDNVEYDAIIIAVAQMIFREMGYNYIKKLGHKNNYL